MTEPNDRPDPAGDMTSIDRYRQNIETQLDALEDCAGMKIVLAGIREATNKIGKLTAKWI